jgi:pyrimidine operon attenuation protein/uracil phosphoribosyltransferase
MRGSINKYFSKTELKYLRNMSDNYVKALEIINRIYKDDLDMSGNTEVGHFIRVSEMLFTEDEKITGLLHDIVEDGFLTFNDLINLGFPKNIINAVTYLTRNRKKHPIYSDYISYIINSNNKLAIRVKYADMLDNSSPRRLNLLNADVKNRLINKYKNELPRLEEKLKDIDDDYIYERKLV